MKMQMIFKKITLKANWVQTRFKLNKVKKLLKKKDS